MSQMRIASLTTRLAILLVCGAGLNAQAPDFTALDAELRFRVSPDGSILMWPDPAFDPLALALEGLEVEHDGTTVTASVSLEQVDVQALVLATIAIDG